MQHIEIIAVMALVPLGAWIAMGEGMVLEWWSKFWGMTTRIVGGDARREFYDSVNGSQSDRVHIISAWLRKPLAECPRCMVSAWGIPAALLTFPDINLWLLPVYILAACGLQEAIHR